ncbi:zinc finger BED domain-containing protein 5-like, partial [Centruroides sculpturatus]|uniref:zinc finger BED domain-containing protein 5-like n=1 Tax=Centruroides sculpturatus TaxID=218467 RepID=UPI000C6EFD97
MVKCLYCLRQFIRNGTENFLEEISFILSPEMEKKRKYSEEYLKFGFTNLTSNGIEKPQCVLCKVVLSHESMKPSKLKRHLETKHSEHTKKDLEFFRRHETSCKRQKLDRTGSFQQESTALVQASYEVALEIAKQKKPHTIGEKLIKPCMLKMVKLILGNSSEVKMQRISLSNNTILRRISNMSVDVKEQILNEIKVSPLFSFQVDESTDISSCSQLLVFVKYIHSDDIKEEFLFCSELETTTKSESFMEKINTFFETGGLKWKNVCGVCMDGAPSMLGSKSGFQKKVKELAPQARGIHCMIHRYALASKTLPTPLQEVLDSLIKIVNYIKSGALNTRLFKELCKDMDSDHEVLLFYTAVRWLSKGNVNRVFELRDEIKLFLEVQGKHDLLVYFNDKAWLKRVAYLADILEQQNRLNLKLQEKETNIIAIHDNLRVFLSKLQNWRRKINLGNIAMFEKLCSVVDESEGEINKNLKEEITGHLKFLENELQRYFPELKEEETTFTQNPFSASLDVASIPDELQDEFLDLRNDSSAHNLFNEKLLTHFWCDMYHSYPNVIMLAFRVLVPFVSTYLCESGFSTLLRLKPKERNELNVENNMRLALTKTHPRILRLVNNMQF